MAGRNITIGQVLGGQWADDESSLRHNLQLLAMVVGFGLLYGAAMGTFSGLWGPRLLQVLYSGLKVPMLLLVTFLVALPSFWVLNLLLGLSGDFPRVFRGLVATQASLTVVLAALCPFTALWYASSSNYGHAILFNGGMFAVASFTAQWRLRQYYRPLVQRNPRHRWMQRLWLLIYCFVGIQMGWTLRPFIGDPNSQIQFFRDGALSNAYVVVGRLLLGLVR